MAEPLIFINKTQLKPGKKEEYLEQFQVVTDIVAAQQPRMLYFAQHVSEDGETATTVQVHSDADNLIHHMQLVGDHIQRATEYIEWSTMSIDLYGTPSEELLEQMRQVAGTGVAVTVNPPAISFSRLPVPQSS